MYSILWEDVDSIHAQTQNALDALRAIRRAIEEGRLGLPNHQDSLRLNRLLVLADLLRSEIGAWMDDVGINKGNKGSNGHQPG